MRIPSPNKSERLPVKANEYWAFVVWKSLPAQLRKLSKPKLAEMGFDTELLEMLTLKTHTEFSKKFGVCMDTLTDWQRLPRFGNDIMVVINNTILSTYKSAIDHTFTMKTLEEADASRVKLWKQLYEGWTEKGELEHSGLVEHNDLVGGGAISKSDILNLVIGKVAKKRGMSAVDLMDKMRDGYYKDMDVQDADIVDEFTYPSDQIYDFNEIEENRKGVQKENLPKANGELSKASADLKNKLMARLEVIKNEEKDKHKLADAIKRVKRKNKGNNGTK